MTKKNALAVARNLSLPLQVAADSLAIIARKGRGKTYAASVLAEELLDRGVQIVVLDPMGAWWGLRSSADGRRDGYPVIIMGGDNGDVTLQPTSGKVVADFVLTRGHSVIVDLAQGRASRQGSAADAQRGSEPPGDGRVPDVANPLLSLTRDGGTRTTDVDSATYIVEGDDSSPAVTAKWAKGTGGPDGDETQNLIGTISNDSSPVHTEGEEPVSTLKPGTTLGIQSAPVVIQDARGMDKGQNGLGVSEDDTAYTLDTIGSQGVAYGFSTQQTPKGWETPELSPTLQVPSASGGGQPHAVAFTQNQRDEVRDLEDVAGSLSAEPGMKQQTYVAGFLPGNGSESGSVGYEDEQSPTIPTGHGGAVPHVHKGDRRGMQVRRLTPTECERLQGFPDGWTDAENDSSRYRMLGNAVCVPVAEWIARRLLAVHEGRHP